MQLRIFSLLLFLFLSTLSFSQLNTELLGDLTYSQNLSDVWGYTHEDGTEYALVGVRNGLSIVSLADPDDPVEVAFVNGDASIWRDIKTFDHYAYVVADQGNDGMLIVNLENLPNSIDSKFYRPDIPGLGLLNRCHNLYIADDGYCYLTGCNVAGGTPIFIDLFTDPWNPSYVDELDAFYAHDVFVQDDVLYSSEIYEGRIGIYDVTDKSNPTLLGSQTTPRNFTHNAWSNEDGTIVFTTDERANAPTTSFDISDYNNIEELDQFKPLESLGSGVIPHNVHFKDDYLIISHYTDGVIIVDAIDPSNMIEVGNYDTWTGSDGGFNGTWGAYPFFESEKILLTDITNGLFVLAPTYTRASRIEGEVTNYVSGAALNLADVEILISQLNATQTNAGGYYKTGVEREGVFDVQYSKDGFITQIHQIPLRKGEAVIKDVKLVPIGSAVDLSGKVTEMPSGNPIENAAVVIYNEDFRHETYTDENGNYGFADIAEGDWTMLAGHWGHQQNSKDIVVSGNTADEDISLAIGYEDDFFGDLGWEITGTMGEGMWERGNPFGTQSNSNDAAPEDDLLDDLGAYAFVTGNRGVNADDDDVDNGTVTLVSDVLELSKYNEPILEFSRWFYTEGSNFFDVRITNGPENALLLSSTTTENFWKDESFNLIDFLVPDDNVTISIEVSDSGADNVVEAAVDGFKIVEGNPFIDFEASIVEGCFPLGVQFSDPNNNTVEWSWTFEGGSPDFSNEKNPFVVFNDPGTYDVSLEVETFDGQTYSLTIEDMITVLGGPTADFTFDVDADFVEFTNTSQDYESSDWDFGDDQGSTEDSPTHTYAEDGSYTVVLEVTNQCGTSSIAKVIGITTLPSASFTSDITSGCPGATVTFESTSSNNTDDLEWFFEGGTPSNSTESNPQIVYNEPGTYLVTLMAFNEAGSDTVTIENYIDIITLPEADFSYNAQSRVVDFSNLSQYETNVLWDFGDGVESTEPDVTHEYQEDGIYTVQLIAFNVCGSDTTELMVEISSLPSALFESENRLLCEGELAEFNNLSSSNSDDFEWWFEGGMPESSTEENPDVIYSQEGNYDVQLIVSNEVGSDTLLLEDYITVDSKPIASFDLTGDGLTVDLNNLSQNYDEVIWDFGDSNASLESDPIHTYEDEGNYLIQLIATNQCGPDTFELSYAAGVLPTAGFESNTKEACLPIDIQFENNSSSNVTAFLWYFEGADQESSNEMNPTVTYSQKGSFDVELIVESLIGFDTLIMEDYIVINDVPEVSFTSESTNLDVTFQDESLDADEILWKFGDGATSTEGNPNHSYETDGFYDVTLIATNECGVDSMTQEIRVTTFPQAAFSQSTTFGCLPATVQYMDMSSNNTTAWEWHFEGGNPSISLEKDPEILYENVGTFDVRLIVFNDTGSDTLDLSDAITIDEAPSAEFNFSIDLLSVEFENLSINADSYNWDFGDGNSSTEANPTHEYEEDGSYTVVLEATNECGTVTIEYEVIIETSSVFENGDLIKSIKVFPNPSNSSFQLAYEFKKTENTEIRIIDPLGRIFDRSFVVDQMGQTEVGSALPSGLYFLQIVQRNKIAWTGRIIKIDN